MAGGYTVPATGELGELFQRLESTERRLRELEMPTGSQVAEIVNRLSQIDNLANRDLGSGFAITTSATVQAQEVFTAPAYATIATFTAVGVATAINDSGSTDSFRAQLRVIPSAGSTGSSVQGIQTVENSRYGTITVAYAADLTLDPGETVTFNLEVRTNSSTWGADSFNQAQVSYQMTLEPVV